VSMNEYLDIPDAYWSLPLDELLLDLKCTKDGLTGDEALKRFNAIGPNSLVEKRQDSLLSLLFRQFKSPIILILLFATLVSGILKDWTDAVIILLIVLGSAILSLIQEYSANSAAQKLKDQIVLKSDLLREGALRSIPAEQIVPGDIILLSAGSLVPADAVMLEAKDFFVNQAVLTGETYPVEKKPGVVSAKGGIADRTNVVFMGTNVRSGSGRAMAVKTGNRTAYGEIADRLALRPPETEFERGIRHLGYLLTEVMFVLVLAIFALNVFFHKPILDSLLFSIALAVGLTPQLLPAIININLSRGSQAMARNGVIVRRLEAIENFGSMDTLCTDKTGTLTAGVVRMDSARDAQGELSDDVILYAYLNAHFQTGLSNPLDEAILAQEKPDIGSYSKVDEIPYDFVRKRLSVIVDGPSGGLLIAKGALTNVLDVCDDVQQGTQKIPLDSIQREQIINRYTQWSEEGYRVLGVAICEVESQSQPYEREFEKGLGFVGFLLFFDPPKEGVQETIKDLATLGVQLKIITGDNQLVARHTAQAVGMENPQVLTGAQLDELHEEALWHAAEKTTIFAEVDPNQKERIILSLKKTGHVVGYMGDGINDAPALHSADVGISVDNAVDVAKEAADFVLLKQDLEVLQQGIVMGRKTFANSLKYVFMATSANFGNMFSVAIASLFLPFLPMLPKQILLINFLTDLPEMTIASDNVDQVYVDRPHRWDVGFIRRFMLTFGPLSSVFDLLTFGVLLLVFRAGQVEFHTGWFVESVLSATLVVFAVRTRLPFTRSQPSRAMLAVTGMVALVTIMLPYSPLAGILGFKALPLRTLMTMSTIVIVYFLAAELTKRWFFKRFLS
jgi:Mg2+-importing ATPase